MFRATITLKVWSCSNLICIITKLFDRISQAGSYSKVCLLKGLRGSRRRVPVASGVGIPTWINLRVLGEIWWEARMAFSILAR